MPSGTLSYHKVLGIKQFALRAGMRSKKKFLHLNPHSLVQKTSARFDHNPRGESSGLPPGFREGCPRPETPPPLSGKGGATQTRRPTISGEAPPRPKADPNTPHETILGHSGFARVHQGHLRNGHRALRPSSSEWPHPECVGTAPHPAPAPPLYALPGSAPRARRPRFQRRYRGSAIHREIVPIY